MANKFISIQSNNRATVLSGSTRIDTPASFTVNLLQPIPQNSRLRVSWLAAPVTWYNVNTSNNKMLVGSSSASITPGNYTLDELLAQVVTDYGTLSGSVITLSYSDITNKISLASSVNHTFAGSGDYPLGDSLFHNILGFTNTAGVSTAGGLSGSNCPALLGDTNFYIQINEFSSLFSLNNTFTPTFSFMASGNRGEYLTYNAKDYNMECVCAGGTNTLTIRVCREDGVLVDGLSDWEMVLERI